MKREEKVSTILPKKKLTLSNLSVPLTKEEKEYLKSQRILSSQYHESIKNF